MTIIHNMHVKTFINFYVRTKFTFPNVSNKIYLI